MNAGGYGVLHYRGDVTRSEGCQPGAILGSDIFGRPFQVIDAEVEVAYAAAVPHDCTCDRRTAVHVEYAEQDNVKAWVQGMAARAQRQYDDGRRLGGLFGVRP